LVNNELSKQFWQIYTIIFESATRWTFYAIWIGAEEANSKFKIHNWAGAQMKVMAIQD
jgi:hypothetical protein